MSDVKAKQEIKDLVVYLTKKYLQNLKYSIKRGCNFHLILVGILFALILLEQGVVFFLFNRQNLLRRVTKVTCRQSLT